MEGKYAFDTEDVAYTLKCIVNYLETKDKKREGIVSMLKWKAILHEMEMARVAGVYKLANVDITEWVFNEIDPDNNEGE
jgi:hypothetical protein